MTYGVTPQGFKPKTFQTLFEETAARLQTELNLNLQENPDSVINVMTNIYLLPLAQSWGSQQAMQSMFNVNDAEGAHLDNLVGWVGLTRHSGLAVAGDIYISANGEITIPAGDEFTDNLGHSFFNDDPISVTRESCTYVKFLLNVPITDGLTLSFRVGGKTYTYVLDGTHTFTQAAEYFNGQQSVATVVAKIIDEEYNLVVTSVDPDQKMQVRVLDNMDVVDIKSFGTVRHEDIGDNTFSANTIINAPYYNEIKSVTNKYVFSGGSEDETDEELRDRHAVSRFKAGKATTNAIRTALLEIEGTVSVLVMENDTDTTDSDGLPMKSIRAVVKGGADDEIANVLYTEKGAGIQLSGNTEVRVLNSEDDIEVIYFSRPEDLFIHVRIAYTRYDAEDFPLDGEDQLAEAVVAFGNAMEPGDDLITQRLESYLLSKVSGLETLQVKVGHSPNATNPTPYRFTGLLRVDNTQEVILDVSRVEILAVQDDWIDPEVWDDDEFWTEQPTT